MLCAIYLHLVLDLRVEIVYLKLAGIFLSSLCQGPLVPLV